jgi:hypothetical protein
VGDTILKYFGLRPINGAIIEEVFHENGWHNYKKKR